jgi:hypothetical protein
VPRPVRLENHLSDFPCVGSTRRDELRALRGLRDGTAAHRPGLRHKRSAPAEA